MKYKTSKLFIFICILASYQIAKAEHHTGERETSESLISSQPSPLHFLKKRDESWSEADIQKALKSNQWTCDKGKLITPQKIALEYLKTHPELKTTYEQKYPHSLNQYESVETYLNEPTLFWKGVRVADETSLQSPTQDSGLGHLILARHFMKQEGNTELASLLMEVFESTDAFLMTEKRQNLKNEIAQGLSQKDSSLKEVLIKLAMSESIDEKDFYRRMIRSLRPETLEKLTVDTKLAPCDLMRLPEILKENTETAKSFVKGQGSSRKWIDQKIRDFDKESSTTRQASLLNEIQHLIKSSSESVPILLYGLSQPMKESSFTSLSKLLPEPMQKWAIHTPVGKKRLPSEVAKRDMKDIERLHFDSIKKAIKDKKLEPEEARKMLLHPGWTCHEKSLIRTDKLLRDITAKGSKEWETLQAYDKASEEMDWIGVLEKISVSSNNIEKAIVLDQFILEHPFSDRYELAEKSFQELIFQDKDHVTVLAEMALDKKKTPQPLYVRALLNQDKMGIAKFSEFAWEVPNEKQCDLIDIGDATLDVVEMLRPSMVSKLGLDTLIALRAKAYIIDTATKKLSSIKIMDALARNPTAAAEAVFSSIEKKDLEPYIAENILKDLSEEVQPVILRFLTEGTLRQKSTAIMGLNTVTAKSIASITQLAEEQTAPLYPRVHALELLQKSKEKKDLVISTIRNLMKDKEIELRKTAIISLATLEKEKVLPQLIEGLKTEDAKFYIYGLGELQEKAAPAASALVQLAEFHPAAVSKALMRIGENAIPEIRRLLSHKSTKVRSETVFSLQFFQKESWAQKVIPDLIRILQDQNETVRHQAINTLLIIGGEKFLPHWIEGFKKANSHEKFEYVYSLATLGEKAASATPHLIPLLNHSDFNLLIYTEKTLAQLGKGSVPYLVDAIKSNNSEDFNYRLIALIEKSGGSIEKEIPKLPPLNQLRLATNTCLLLESIFLKSGQAGEEAMKQLKLLPQYKK